jgi:hypothetical protein
MRVLEEIKASAGQLRPVNDFAAKAYADNGMAMAAAVTNMLMQHEDIERIIGQGNAATMAENHRRHAEFISGMLENFRSELFVETLVWVFRTYRARGFAKQYWVLQLKAWRDTISANLEAEHARQVDEIYVWMLENLDDLYELSSQEITAWEK